MLLYVQHQKVSATVFAILLAIHPLTTLVQIPVAKWIAQWGYKGFLTLGWKLRVFIGLCISAVAIMPSSWLTPLDRVVLLIVLVGFFCTLRNIAYCAYMPWAMRLLPPERQGKFVSTDFMVVNASNLIMMLLTLVCLHFLGYSKAYFILFFLAALFSFVSRWFISKMPEAPTDMEYQGKEPIPWRAMFEHPPFKKLLKFQVLVLMAWAGGGVFYLPFMKDRFGVSDEVLTSYNILWTVVFVASCPLVNRWISKFGCKPVLQLGGILQVTHFLMWWCLNFGLVPFNQHWVVAGQIVWGLSFPVMLIGVMQLLIKSIPEKGRTHFLAIFTAVSSLAAGIAPFAWGIIIDSMKQLHIDWGTYQWNAHSVGYVLAILVYGYALLYLRTLSEPQSKSAEQFLLHLIMKSPAGYLVRLIQNTRPSNP